VEFKKIFKFEFFQLILFPTYTWFIYNENFELYLLIYKIITARNYKVSKCQKKSYLSLLEKDFGILTIK
jgi:MFS-type transporter involved in bile tolerance (Atg22 family)